MSTVALKEVWFFCELWLLNAYDTNHINLFLNEPKIQ